MMQLENKKNGANLGLQLQMDFFTFLDPFSYFEVIKTNIFKNTYLNSINVQKEFKFKTTNLIGTILLLFLKY